MRCAYWVPSKRRLCAAAPLPCSRYCGNHQGGSDRVPCPIDSSHTVTEARLAAHLKKCPASKQAEALSQCSFYKPAVNSGCTGDDAEDCEEEEEEDGRAAFHSMSAEQVELLVRKISDAYTAECVNVAENVADLSVMEPPACRAWLSLQVDRRQPQQMKHIAQQASMLGNMEEFGLLSGHNTVVEFGAGRGYLSHMLCDSYPQHDKVLLVERRSYKFKADRTLRCSPGVSMERLRVDIADLELRGVESLRGCCFVAVGKHICGAATDMSLRCCVANIHSLAGIGFATCCHHLCRWKAYVNKEFFLRLGFTSSDFRVLVWLTSWALSGHSDERAELGLRCKQLLDCGRLHWLRAHGLSCKMVAYVLPQVSPENKLLLAVKPHATS